LSYTVSKLVQFLTQLALADCVSGDKSRDASGIYNRSAVCQR